MEGTPKKILKTYPIDGSKKRINDNTAAQSTKAKKR